MDKMHINCDVGENDEMDVPFHLSQHVDHIDAVNIACGFHAGNPTEIQKIIDVCIEDHIEMGIHPSYNDRRNFGRVVMEQSLDVLANDVAYQIHAVNGLITQAGGQTNHVKFHGALYNLSAQDKGICDAVMLVLAEILPGIKVYGLAGTQHESVARKYRLEFVAEGFGDRAYKSSSQLVSRSLQGALIEEPEAVVRQVRGFLEDHEVTCVDGKVEPIHIDTICIHGDNKMIGEILPLLHRTFR